MILAASSTETSESIVRSLDSFPARMSAAVFRTQELHIQRGQSLDEPLEVAAVVPPADRRPQQVGIGEVSDHDAAANELGHGRLGVSSEAERHDRRLVGLGHHLMAL